MDLVIKYRYFRHLSGGSEDDSALRLYFWHLEERRKTHYDGDKGPPDDPDWKPKFLAAAGRLFSSMRDEGFKPEYAVPIDPDWELLGGAHRVACAMALNKNVTVEFHTQRVWAPAWDRQWFVNHGMAAEDLERLDADWKELTDE